MFCSQKVPLHHQTCRGRVVLALLAFLLVGLVVLVGCGLPSPGSVQVSPPTAITRNALPFEQLHMFTQKTGWAITSASSSAHHILHTSAGVNAWQDVTPHALDPLSSLTATAFFDPVTAWVAAGDVLYHTRDAGQTWEQSQVRDQGTDVRQMFFLTQQLGWLLVVKAAFTGNMTVDVLRTTDGGASWKVISVSNSPHQSHPDAIPFQGTKSGLTFVNPATGWMTGFTNADHFPWLYITHDGGVTWQHQSISLPADAYQVTTLAPTFFNASDGILPVLIPRAVGQTVTLYVTQDGGRHWNPTTAVSPTSFTAEDIQVIDPMHSFVASNTFAPSGRQYIQSTIYRTIDGGVHWMFSTVKLGADIIMIDFVSPTVGWAIDSLHTLFQTTDGGHIWVRV